MKTRTFFLVLMVLAVISTACEKEFSDALVPYDAEMQKGAKHENAALKTFDAWGFNWNACHFDGYLVNAILADHAFAGFPHFKQTIYQGEGMPFWDDLLEDYPYLYYFMPGFLLDTRVVMHWNKSLISKEGIYPAAWIDTDAWINFKFTGMTDSKRWSHFRKLVAVTSTDELSGDGVWLDKDKNEIGLKSDWAELMVIQVINTGDVPPVFHDTYRSPSGAGLGYFGAHAKQ